MLRQILVDVPRTSPDVPLFHQAPVQRCLERLLYVWALKHPASGYVQGINDLATPQPSCLSRIQAARTVAAAR